MCVRMHISLYRFIMRGLNYNKTWYTCGHKIHPKKREVSQFRNQFSWANINNNFILYCYFCVSVCLQLRESIHGNVKVNWAQNKKIII